MQVFLVFPSIPYGSQTMRSPALAPWWPATQSAGPRAVVPTTGVLLRSSSLTFSFFLHSLSFFYIHFSLVQSFVAPLIYETNKYCVCLCVRPQIIIVSICKRVINHTHIKTLVAKKKKQKKKPMSRTEEKYRSPYKPTSTLANQ